MLDLLGEDPEALPRAPVPPPGTLEELAILEQQYLQAAPETKERISRVVERGPIGAFVKRLNGYRCQVCEALGLDAIGFLKPDGSLTWRRTTSRRWLSARSGASRRRT